MTFSWLGKVSAPKEVEPNISFSIKWNVWVIQWPWKKGYFYTNLIKGEKEVLGATVYVRSFFKKFEFSHEDSIDVPTDWRIKTNDL